MTTDWPNLKVSKPPYVLPTMKQIAEVSKNGYKIVSTFSGCGGSCLGFEMSGYQVLWANEFIPAAQETYRANHPYTYLDIRDIRKVTAEDILAQIGLKKGELDVFEGSPPCASFSMAGKREKMWGQVKKYSDTEQRVDDLFFEYARILEGLQPKVFVAENVKGLTIGKAKNLLGSAQVDFFGDSDDTIYHTLRNCGYNVQRKILNAKFFGVPQARERLILIGVRKDLELEPVYPVPFHYVYTLRDALPWIVSLKGTGKGFGHMLLDAEKPCYTVTASMQSPWNAYELVVDADVEKEMVTKREDEGGARRLSLSPDEPSPTVMAGSIGSVNTSQYYMKMKKEDGTTEKRKFSIAELRRICAFPPDFILTGSYAQQWERLGRAVPPVLMYHIAHTVQTQILDILKAKSNQLQALPIEQMALDEALPVEDIEDTDDTENVFISEEIY